MTNNNTRQHSFRMSRRLWAAYRKHRKEIGSNASEGLRNHAVAELDAAGKLTPEMLEPDEKWS